MAFTDNCDLYAAVHEDGINLVARHIMRQRPSLFNYASQYVSLHPELACHPVDHTVDVDNHHNPLFTVEPAIPIFGVDAPPVGLNFCAQLVDAEIDFHPGNVITLPAELNPPLKPQHMAMHIKVCGGIDCPVQGFIDQIPPGSPFPGNNPAGTKDGQQPPPEVVFPTRRLICFCLDAFVIAHVELVTVSGKPALMGKVDGVDIVDITPDNLEAGLNCYLRTTIELILREKLTIPLEKLALSFPLFGVPVSLQPTPNPPIPNNPAIEDDQLKAFVTMM
ncbi:MAG TPA: hypothetical protein VI685_02390 [Candidatus Angelobacter sp.]